MNLIKEPRVYLVGKQTFDPEGWRRFCKEELQKTPEDFFRSPEESGTHPEELCEAAGRLCYMSYSKGRKSNKEYLRNIIESMHGSVTEHAVWNFVFCGVSRSLTHELVRHRTGVGYCLTGDTLIYSERKTHDHRNGPKKRKLKDLYEMTKTGHGRSRIKLLKLRCLDEGSHQFTTGRIKGVAYSGKRHVYKVDLEGGKSITCSRDHRFLTPNGWKPLHAIVGGLERRRNGLVTCGSLTTPIAVNGQQPYKNKEWLKLHYIDKSMEQEDIAEFLGVSKHTIRSWVRKHNLQKPIGSWSIGKDPWNKGTKYTAGWNHTEETKERLSEAKKGEKNPQWRGGVTPQGNKVRSGVGRLIPKVMQRCSYTCQLCKIPSEEMQIHHILPVWARPDLVRDINNITALCKDCHLKISGKEAEYAESLGATPEDVADLKSKKLKRTGKPLAPHFVRIESVSYAGVQDTYDIEMDGDNPNFVANGIVTHNSQLSQRYVDASECSFVIPAELQGEVTMAIAFLESRGVDINNMSHKDLIGPLYKSLVQSGERNKSLLAGMCWLSSVHTSQQAYCYLADYLTERLNSEMILETGPLGLHEPTREQKTQNRKTARGTSRSVLPNATETKIFVSMNGRAARHMIEMRCSRHAEVEIRTLFGKVWEILVKEAPNLFGDYSKAGLPDGTFELVTQNRKI